MKKKRIAIITDYFPPYNGGVANSVHRIAGGLTELMGENIIVIAVASYNNENQYPQVAKECLDGILVYRLYCTKNIPINDAEDRRLGYYLLTEVLKGERVDLIHAFYTFSSGYWANLIYKTSGIPYILSIRGNDLTKNYFDIRVDSILSEIMTNALKITVVNNYLFKFINQHYPTLNAKTVLIYNSIDVNDFCISKKNRSFRNANFEKTDFVFSYIGVIKEKKGLRMLIEAFNRLSCDYNHVKLLLVGEIYQSMHSDISRKINENNMIFYFDKVEHNLIKNFFDASDAFVIPSYDDGLPNSMLEAIASNIPIITSKIFDDVFTNNTNALIFDTFNCDDLYNCMKKIVCQPEMGKELAKNASALLKNNFSFKKEIKSYYKLYSSEK